MVLSDVASMAVTASMAALIAAEVAVRLCVRCLGAPGLTAAPFEPAKAALLPSLVREPDELTAANVVSSTIASVTVLVGPALGGVLLAVTSVEVVVAVTAACYGWSALLVSLIRSPAAPWRGRRQRPHVWRELTAGLRTAATHPSVRLIVIVMAVQVFTDGALAVLTVAGAIDLLGAGEAGVGYLTAALGVGGLLGAVVSLGLVGRKRLAPGLALGMVLWGAPLIVIGGLPSVAIALVMLALVGLGNTLLDVSGFTLLQRARARERPGPGLRGAGERDAGGGGARRRGGRTTDRRARGGRRVRGGRVRAAGDRRPDLARAASTGRGGRAGGARGRARAVAWRADLRATGRSDARGARSFARAGRAAGGRGDRAPGRGGRALLCDRRAARCRCSSTGGR